MDRGYFCPVEESQRKETETRRLFAETCRARIEHSIAELTNGRKALKGTWRGSLSLLDAVMKVSMHMHALHSAA